MEEDITKELEALFAQTSASRWYPLIKSHTFKTVEFPLTPRQARALLTVNRHTRGELRDGEELAFAQQELTQVLDLLNEAIRNEFTGEHISLFVKLTDRSPKDATNLDEKQRRLYHTRLQQHYTTPTSSQCQDSSTTPPTPQEHYMYSNSCLQAYVWAKCHALRIESAQEAIDLLIHSERVAAELEMKLETSTSQPECGLLLREFCTNFDPAMEFRAFVHNDALVAMSQMASMDVILHYPQVVARRQELSDKALQFFDRELRDVLRPITAAGPSSDYVLDLYFDVTRDTFKVVELNPFQTSSSGHLFRYWNDTDAKVLSGHAPFEFRLRNTTPTSALDDVPKAWQQELKKYDTYEVTEADWQHHCAKAASAKKKGSGSEQQLLRRHSLEAGGPRVVIVASGRPEYSFDINRDETKKAVLRAYQLAVRTTSPSNITVLAYDNDHASQLRSLATNDGQSGSSARVMLSSPDRCVTAIKDAVRWDKGAPNNGQLFLFIAGHGATDHSGDTSKEDEYVTAETRGQSYFYQSRKPDSHRWWLQFPHPASSLEAIVDHQQRSMSLDYNLNTECDAEPVMRDSTLYSLHWPTLVHALTSSHCSNTADQSPSVVAQQQEQQQQHSIFVVLGACYSGGLFTRWLTDFSDSKTPVAPPQTLSSGESALIGSSIESSIQAFLDSKGLSVLALTSSDIQVAAGTWFWHRVLDLIEQALEETSRCTSGTTDDPWPVARIYQQLRASDPLKTSTEESRGDAADVAICSFFASGAEAVNSVSIGHIFTVGNKLEETKKNIAAQHHNINNNNNNNQEREAETNGQASLLTGDLRTLLTSGSGADCSIVASSGTSFHLHRSVLNARCPATIGALLQSGDRIKLSADLSDAHVEALLEFLYAGPDARRLSWDTPDWNRLMMATLELGWDDVTDMLIVWREQQTQGRKRGTLKGDVTKRIVPGWKRNKSNKPVAEPQQSDDCSDCLTLAFEFEGNALQIFRYYRPESVDEAQWRAMSLSQCYALIKGNWAHLKRRIDSRAFHWMNPNLTIEDAGFVWEVSYGGDTPGYAVDLDHLCECMHEGVDAGLTLGDREMDSGIQAHIAFPFMEADDQHCRESLLALMVHLDDYLFLREFVRSIIDDCNNLWTNDDVTVLFDAARSKGVDTLESLVTSGVDVSLDKAMPNPRMKHKHVGLRGIDCYKTKNRFGWEIRRGHTIEQLEEFLRYICQTVFPMIGAMPDTQVPIRLRTAGGHGNRPQPYTLADVHQFVVTRKRVVVQQADDTAVQSFGLDVGCLDAVAADWTRRMVEWEDHLVHTKLMLWGGTLATGKRQDSEFEARALNKVRRRLLFVLCTDWSLFPVARGDARASGIVVSLREEQAHICKALTQVVPLAKRRELESHRHDQPELEKLLATDDVMLTEVRSLISDFAVRLARLY
eukprot:TRINITY_DN6271_c0_g1_i1.p1 TRINITY_DN6271_c0_g1~~TRINITY_DN6271_c0_g1_i1.p1  ORF type:complete len:1416 (-),score=246.75 TRINITY_DN6271_c0_g1_i1:142-4389(-)